MNSSIYRNLVPRNGNKKQWGEKRCLINGVGKTGLLCRKIILDPFLKHTQNKYPLKT